MYSSNTKADAAKLYSDVSKIINQFMRKNFDDIGMTMPQCIVAFTLAQFGEMKISELSDNVHLSNSTVSGILDRLEKSGLVERTRNDEDRRTVYVNVTKKFHEEHEGLHKKIEERFEDLLCSSTPEEMEKIIEGLDTLKKVLKNRKES